MLREDLIAHLKSFNAAPFLFVGSGMSRRYLGLETWDALLERFAERTGRPYARFRSQADGDYPATATAIAEVFHDLWWDEDAYQDSRDRYESHVTRRDSPLKIEISRHVEHMVENLDLAGPYADELRLLQEIEVDGIITTNYDGLLERLFPSFRPFVGQDDILFSETQGIGEIFKIHGSHELPNSLVLTAADYEDFRNRNAYLAAKLLTVFVDHPVIFLGYSLQDRYILEILHSIARGLTTDHLQKLQDRLIFIEWDETAPADPELRSMTFNLGGPLPVRHAKVAHYSPIFAALGEVERRLPVRVLRQLKERVYELVRTTEPVGALRVISMDDNVDLSRVEVVVGVGIIDRIGYLGLKREHLIEDILTDSSNLDHERLVATALTGILREARLSPVFKYLRGANLLDRNGGLDSRAAVTPEIRRRVEEHDTLIAPKPDSYGTKGDDIAARVASFTELVAQEQDWHVLMYVTRLAVEKQEPDALKQFLLEHREFEKGDNIVRRVHWYKAVCLYDWLAYGPGSTVASTRT